MAITTLCTKTARAGLGLSLALCLSCAGDDARRTDGAARVEVPDALLRALQVADAEVRVIVHFREPPPDVVASGMPQAIAQMQEGVLARKLEGFTVTHRYRHVPALAGHIRREALEQLRSDATIEAIEVDGEGEGQLREAVPAIGGDRVKSQYGVTGRGVRVAVLDTGIDVSHPDLRDAVVAEHCFTQRACGPNGTFEGTSAQDDHGHGSNAAGIIASNGVVSSVGFAPDAEIVAVKVNDASNHGYESDWVAGLDWVYANLATLKVRVVNMSLGTTLMHADNGSCDVRHPALLRAIRNLTQAGVTVFAASGNSGSPTTMAAPGCNTGPITVGATYDSALGHQPPGAATYFDRWGGAFGRCGDDRTMFDQITCFTNSNARLDLVAPGAAITSDALWGRVETYYGTSQASPAAAGVAALMLQCNPQLTPADIKRIMTSTGVKVVDPKNGRSFPSLRAFEAVRAACPRLENGAVSVWTDAGAEESGSGRPTAGPGTMRTPSGATRSDSGARGRAAGAGVDVDNDDDLSDEPGDVPEVADDVVAARTRASMDRAQEEPEPASVRVASCSAQGPSGRRAGALAWMASALVLGFAGRRRRVGRVGKSQLQR